MSDDESNRPEATAPQLASEPIEGILTPAIVSVPLGGSLELGRDGQYRYHPKRNFLSAADAVEFVAV